LILSRLDNGEVNKSIGIQTHLTFNLFLFS
jgi:hypothetical protein